MHRNSHFCFHIPLKLQLSRLFSGPQYHELNKTNKPIDNCLFDITSGEIYKTSKQSGVIFEGDCTIQINFNRIEAFKSSKTSMSSAQDSINELRPAVKNNNILLTGL